MKSLEVRIPHKLEKPEVRRRLDAAVEKVRRDYADKVRQLDAHWEREDRLAVKVVVLAMNIVGEIDNEPGEVVVRVELPGMLTMFAGKIRTGVEERLGGLLSPPS